MPVDQSRQYLRIRDQLAADIAQGVLQVKLPSERELAERFLCTRIRQRVVEFDQEFWRPDALEIVLDAAYPGA